MSKFLIYIGDVDYSVCGENYPICGVEAAWEAYKAACDFGSMVGRRVCLIDGETGEVIADSEGY